VNLMLEGLVGLGLSAACGFKVFAPFLLVSLAALTGHLELTDNFRWVGTYPALMVFLSATILEVLAYYIPVVDNFLDTVATPAAVIAGSVMTASFISDLSPLLQWSLGIIAGGSVAGTVQLATVGTRGISTATTGGGGNFLVTTGETVSSFVLSLLAILFPLLAVLLVSLLIYFISQQVWRRLKLQQLG
ncbi:MAG: DUF4126 domain-containing protein, partial [Bacillota bacterium]